MGSPRNHPLTVHHIKFNNGDTEIRVLKDIDAYHPSSHWQVVVYLKGLFKEANSYSPDPHLTGVKPIIDIRFWETSTREEGVSKAFERVRFRILYGLDKEYRAAIDRMYRYNSLKENFGGPDSLNHYKLYDRWEE